MAWAACSSGGLGWSMVRYSEQSEENTSFSAEDEAISSEGEVRRVTVRGVGGKKVGIP